MKVSLYPVAARSVGDFLLGTTAAGLVKRFAESGRELLLADRTYYVRTDGSNSNNGLANTAGGAWLTLQYAYDFISSFVDFGGHTVTIQVGAGTYGIPSPDTAGDKCVLAFEHSWVGGGCLTILGDRTTPSNVILDPNDADGFCFYTNSAVGCRIEIYGFKLQNTQTTNFTAAIFNNAPGVLLYFGDLNFGAWAGGNHIWAAQPNTTFCFNQNYTISGGALNHIFAEENTVVDFELGTITLSGTPAFTGAFAVFDRGSTFLSDVNYSGSATGQRFLAEHGGHLVVRNTSRVEQSTSYLPGNAEGVLRGGSSYNNIIYRSLASAAPGATPSINTDNCDFMDLTGLTAAITSMTTNLSGTPINGQRLTIRFKDNGTARSITWGASFEACGVALPTTTVISKRLTVGFLYDTTTSKWGCVASVQEA